MQKRDCKVWIQWCSFPGVLLSRWNCNSTRNIFFCADCLVRVLKPCHLASKTTTLRSNLLRRQLHCKQSLLLFNSNCHKYVDFTIQLLPHKYWSFKTLLKYLNSNEGRIKLNLVTNTQINLKLQPLSGKVWIPHSPGTDMGQMGGGAGGRGGLCKSLELIATQNHEKVRIYEKIIISD